MSRRFVSRIARAAAGGAFLCACTALFSPAARAACTQSGAEVDCTGNDFNGFRSGQSLTIRIRPGAFIQNEITGDIIGTCPLSFPAIATGRSSTVISEGTISTAGVCGSGITAGRDSAIVNLGALRTSDFLSYGIIADDNSFVRNAGAISTASPGSSGVFSGAGSRIVNEAAGRIATAGAGSSGVEAGAGAVIINAGDIAATGGASHGIDAGPGAAVANSGSIATSANNSTGVRLAGGSLVNSGSIQSILSGPGFAATPTVGVSITGSTADFTNTASGTVVATHIGVRVSGVDSASISNSGRIDVSPALQFDGTPSPGGAAILITGATGVGISNSGSIIARGGLPALRSDGPRVELRNTGTITGDILLGGGNDTVLLATPAGVNGLLDFSGGADTLVVQAGGFFGIPVANLERLSMNGVGTLIFVRDTTAAEQINVFGGGGVVIDRGVRLTAAVTDNLGTIRGVGTLAGALDNAGVVAPGTASEMGSLTVTGAFRQYSGGTLAVRLSPGGSSDRLIVGGPATLGGTLSLSYEVTPGGPYFQDGQRFTVLAPLGTSLTSVGAFTLSAPRSAFLAAKLVTPPEGGIVVEIERRSYGSAGMTATQTSAGRMLDRRPPALSSTIHLLETAAPEGAAEILAALAPESPGGLQSLSLLALGAFTRTARATDFPRPEAGRFAWARGFTSSGRSRGSAAPADFSLDGAAAGTETPFGDFGLGVAAARIGGGFARGSDAANYHLSIAGLTARYTTAEVDVDASLAYGAGSPEIRRARSAGETTGILAMSADIAVWAATVSGTLRKPAGPLVVMPHIGFDYFQTELAAIDELQPLAARTSDATARSLRARFGVGFAGVLDRARPYGDISASVEFLDRRPEVPASLIGAPGSEFTLYGDARRRVALEAAAGLVFALADGLEAHVAGSMIANDLSAGRTLSAGLRFLW